MFENTNKALPVEIARETMKVHRLRNCMACLAIVLMTVLITVICGAGVSTVDAVMAESGIKPEPGTDGAGIYGDLQTLEKVREQPGVEWADIARPCMQGTPKNREFAGNTVKFVAVDNGYYKHHYVKLLSGEYPENGQEVLMSDTLAEKIGREMAPGQKITLGLVVLKDGKVEQKPLEMTICGFYDSPFERLGDYEELYTVEEFPDIYNPGLNDISSVIYVKFADVNAFSKSDEISDKLSVLNKAAGGNGILVSIEAEMEEELKSMAALLAIVIVCGFFLIYNIFSISVVNDIRFIGNMKVIGMTRKQIGVMFWWQVRRLGAVGIAIGIILGACLNFFIIHYFQTMSLSYAKYYDINSSLLFAFLFAAVFSAGTVWVSSQMALSLAREISPVAASKFRNSGRKKKIFAVVSFALGSILFCAVFTVFAGYDIEWMVGRMNESDFVVEQWHAKQLMFEPYEPMAEELIQDIRKLGFVKDSYLFYRARGERCDRIGQDGIYEESMGEVKMEGHYKEVMEKEYQKLGFGEEGWDWLVEKGKAETGIIGMEPDAMDMEMENMDILDGKAETDLFASGDYLIYQPYALPEDMDKKEYTKYGMKAGDKVKLSFWVPGSQEYQTREFTVMAVVSVKDDNYAGSIEKGMQFVISDTMFQEIYVEDARKMISALHINTLGEDLEAEQETLEQMVKDSFNFQVKVGSKYKTRKEQENKRFQEMYIGIIFGLVVAVIGLVNIVNTIVTDVISRKLEYVAMQSIGMTKRQMAVNICLDGMKMIVPGFVLACFFTVPAAQLLASLLFVKFVSSMYIVSCLLVFGAGLLLNCIISYVLVRSLNKKAVVERLREAE